MTERIRWKEALDGEATGYVGTLDRPVFRLWPPDEDGDRMLFVYLAGRAGDLYHGTTADGQKAVAERLLTEFVSSFGASFPAEPDRWTALRSEIQQERTTQDNLAAEHAEWGRGARSEQCYAEVKALDWVLATMERMEGER